MRLSEFDRAVDAEFGARGRAMLDDLALAQVGYRTAAEALKAGISTRDVWLALCEEADVPRDRRYGVGRLDPHDR